MASFTDALRSSGITRLAGIQRRQAGLRGRPLTSSEAAAPYEAQASTAADRLTRLKSIELAESGQKQQSEQFRESLAQQSTLAAESRTLQRELSAEQARLQAQALAEQKAARLAQMAVAEEANRREAKASTASTLVGAGSLAVDLLGNKEAISTIKDVGSQFLDWVSGDLCIVVSACTRPDSYDVALAREFKRLYLGPVSHAGYHVIARPIVPLILRFPWFKRLVKRGLVDRLVDYGEWALGYKVRTTMRKSKWIARAFLWACRWVGTFRVKQCTRRAENA